MISSMRKRAPKAPIRTRQDSSRAAITESRTTTSFKESGTAMGDEREGDGFRPKKMFSCKSRASSRIGFDSRLTNYAGELDFCAAIES